MFQTDSSTKDQKREQWSCSARTAVWEHGSSDWVVKRRDERVNDADVCVFTHQYIRTPDSSRSLSLWREVWSVLCGSVRKSRDWRSQRWPGDDRRSTEPVRPCRASAAWRMICQIQTESETNTDTEELRDSGQCWSLIQWLVWPLQMRDPDRLSINELNLQQVIKFWPGSAC